MDKRAIQIILLLFSFKVYGAGITVSPQFYIPTVVSQTVAGTYTYTLPTTPKKPIYLKIIGVGGGGGGGWFGHYWHRFRW